MERTTVVLQRRIEQGLARRGVEQAASSTPLFAYVNHGRWVANCSCGGAELVAEGKRMVCGSCGLNSPVTFPPNVGAIESVLHARKGTAVKNWTPGETVEMLEAENMSNH